MEGEKSPGKARHLVGPAEPIDANLSPDAFHIYATHYYKCKQDFKPPDDYFSPVPYFLHCRAIELELKARHLKYWRQRHVKEDFGHRLLAAYRALDAQEQTLSQSEVAVLTAVDEIYAAKAFEYFSPYDAATEFSRYRSYLETLDSMAKKLIDSGSTSWG